MKKFVSIMLCLIMITALAAPIGAASAAQLAPSDALVEFIKSGEGFVGHVYYSGGYAYIGYGVMCRASDYPNGITEAQATELLRSVLEANAAVVNRYAAGWKTSLNQAQFDAILSLTYNLGSGWLTGSGKLITALRAGTLTTEAQVADCFGAHCHAGGINRFLIQRRLTEAGMFLYGDYSGSHNDKFTWLELNYNGGSADNDIAFFEKGKPYGVLPEAWKTGSYFAGWTSNGRTLLPTDIAGEPMTVTAAWSSTPVVLPTPEPIPELPSSRFSDVPDGAWYIEYVEPLCEAGVIDGYPDGSFRPNDPVTFGQALKLVLLATGSPEQPQLGSHWADGYLAAAMRRELFLGEAQSLDSPASRLLMAHLAANALGLSPSEDTPFSDCDDPLVNALFATGVITGSDGADSTVIYRPDSTITRAETAALIYRLRAYAL